MARTIGICIVLALALSVAVAQNEGGGVPTAHSCEISVSSLDPVDFVNRALGGDVGCVDMGDKSSCCNKLRGLFGWDGPASLCLCNREFYSALVFRLPSSNDVDAQRYSEMLSGCDIPVLGKTKCPGTTEEYQPEPLAESQVLGALLLARAVSGGSGGGRGGGSSGGGGSPPPPPPPPPPAAPVPPKPLPIGGPAGKAAKPVIFKTAAPAVVAAGIGGSLGPDFSGTVFAPNNGAFSNLLTKLELDLAILLDERSKDLVTKILQLHVVPGQVLKADALTGGQTLNTLLGGSETLAVTADGGVLVSGPGNESAAKVVAADVEACGSVVHILENVLVPSPEVSSQAGFDFGLAG
ncbi:hypothetical protein BSKO_10079 [Bryopsis sp. KO-2023]|nr:hypothetical protein BSKO_10079 [Bryopsis sp. KO-2023]